MKLLMDFDDTVFNAGKFKQHLFYVAERYGVNDIELLYKQARERDTPFSLKKFLQEAMETASVDKAVVLDQVYEEVMAVCDSCINEEVLQVVRSIGKSDCSMVTQGDREYQEDKIDRSGVREYFSQVIIVTRTKKDVVEEFCQRYPTQDIIFVDDKVKFFNDIDMEKCGNLKTVVFNEHGLENLTAEIERSKHSEMREVVHTTPNPFLKGLH
jgi:FMN phosphatase YigB (HAD superfamily)